MMTMTGPSQESGKTIDPIDKCPSVLLDGMLVHTAALGAGRSTTLFPGQALLVDGPTSGRVAFAHGIPQQTQLSMATFVQDKRVRRALLEQNRFPVPKGATFSVGRGGADARAFAERLGYPVSVKPMVGDSTIENFPRVADPDELASAFEYFRTAPQYREAYESASYAFTAIHTPQEGTTATKRSYRLLIEENVSGEYLRFVVIGDEIASAVSLPEGLDLPSAGSEVLHATDPTVRRFVSEIAEVFSGLTLVVIDLVLSVGHDSPIEDQNAYVVEIAERPWLHVQRSVSAASALQLGGRILAAGESTGTTTAPDADSRMSAAVQWQGVTVMERFIHQMRTAAEVLDAEVTVETKDPVGGVAAGHISGSPATIALLNETAVAGHFDGERIMAVRTTQ